MKHRIMANFLLFVLFSVIFTVSGNVNCPEKYGKFANSGQCDAYVECIDGIGEEKLCPDGLVFDPDAKGKMYPCKYPIEVSCQGRTKLQPADPTEDCPHQFGFYRLGDKNDCGAFLNCAGGIGYVTECPDGLAFNSETYQCDWPDMVEDCDAEAFLGFNCPEPPKSSLLGTEENRYFKSNDCRYFFVCIDGKPRKLGCSEDQAFNELTNSCDGIENVTGCAGGNTGNKQCTKENDRFAVEKQCDAYLECIDGFLEEKLCPDGLLFNNKSDNTGECQFLPLKFCGNRTELQKPKPTDNCPRQFAFYKVGNSSQCDIYMNCAHGIGSLTHCPEGLAFNINTYQCDWPDLVPDCDAEAYLKFICPKLDDDDDYNGEMYTLKNKRGRFISCATGHPRLLIK